MSPHLDVRMWVGRAVPLLALLAAGALLLPSPACSDEVDDILAKKARNRDRINRMSGEFVVETAQPSSLKNPKKVKMHYRMSLERMPAAKVKHSHNPWKMEAEVISPLPMRFKTEGEQAFYMDQHGTWIAMALTPELEQQFGEMSERFMGADPAEQRKRFSIRLLRHNNPVFGPRTRTIEYVPVGKARKLFARMEEDVNGDGLALATRLYDDTGKRTVEVKVKKHHRDQGLPIVDEFESTSDSPAGVITSHSRCLGSRVEVR